MFICPCGYQGNAVHSKKCEVYKQELEKIASNAKSYITNEYLKNFSVSECCEIVKEKENTDITTSRIRKIVESILDKQGVREGLDGENLNKSRQQKLKDTMVKKYGVSNNGQREGQGWGSLNKIKYKKLDVDEEFKDYRKKVDYLTRKYVEKLKNQNKIPEECFYTGLNFQDTIKEQVNPNDPYKRSVDHRIPVIEMFLKGKSPEETASKENIVFCLRILNTYKANTSEDYFIKEIVPYLKERL